MQRGERLREIRRQRGLPVDVLAHMAGCSTRTLVVYEKWGIMPRRRETRERIARVLGVDPDWLFPESEEVESQ
jgi:transcriptional regulator with XRE-family HTH domain